MKQQGILMVDQRGRSLLLGGLLWASMALVAPKAEAEFDVISTDRPDVVESSLTVGKGRLQLESSVAYEHDRSGGMTTRTWSAPTLLRIGIGESWEARVETDGPLHERLDRAAGENNASGMGDIALGLKHHLGAGEDSPWSRALLMHLDLPSGDGHWKGHKYRPSLRYVAERELSEKVCVGLMPGLVYNTDDVRDYYLAGLLAVTTAYQWTDNFRSFIEVAGTELGGGDHSEQFWTFNGGLAWTATPDVQFDFVFNAGLNEAAPDLMLGTGVSVRW